jgi:hypothetical protein
MELHDVGTLACAGWHSGGLDDLQQNSRQESYLRGHKQTIIDNHTHMALKMPATSSRGCHLTEKHTHLPLRVILYFATAQASVTRLSHLMPSVTAKKTCMASYASFPSPTAALCSQKRDPPYRRRPPLSQDATTPLEHP